MILDELVLYNFGVYRGRQRIELTPPSDDKPIILIGGMNGGGKTTFLDALHLVLYGKRAKCSNRNRTAYDDFLAESISRDAPRAEGAALELEFRHPFEGREQAFRVHRSWYPTEKSVSESVEVHRNGKLDSVISESWDDFVEEFMPVGVSDLFFFDGEKIARFAELNNASKLLETAIHTLLGLDLVDQLSTDLVALERRKKTDAQPTDVQQKIHAAEEELERIRGEEAHVKSELARLRTDLNEAQKELESIDERYRMEGGDLYDQRNEIEAEYRTLQDEIEDAENELRDIAAGCAPLLQVRDLLGAVAEQDEREQKAMRAEILCDTLEDRDHRILAQIEEREGQSDLYQSMKSMLDQERAELTEEQQVERFLKLDEHARHQLQVLLRSQLDETDELISRKLTDFDALREEEVRLDRKIAAIPESEALAELIERRNKFQEELDAAKQQRDELKAEQERLSERVVEAADRVDRRYGDLARAEYETKDIERMLNHSERVRDTLGDFRTAITDRHIERIESLVLDSFRKLLRKRDLVADLDIDSETFHLQLWDGKDNNISPERLSAGERQLLAVSLLWGLARASGRPLPTVIDTPLGRLDSSHRGFLVERYFPFASHQVLLLSTDEEIGERYYERIQPSVGREYTLEYDDERGSTRIQEGYNIIGAKHVA